MRSVRPEGTDVPLARRPVGVCSCTAQGSDELNADSDRVGAGPPIRWLIPMWSCGPERETARQVVLGAVSARCLLAYVAGTLPLAESSTSWHGDACVPRPMAGFQVFNGFLHGVVFDST
jgi:hypothetical protein